MQEGFRGPSILSMFKPGRRSSSSASSGLDSDQIVERLVSMADPVVSTPKSRPASADSRSDPHPSPPSPQKSPGMAWKQTVLLPVNVPPFHSAAVTVTADISPAPSRLKHAGWDGGVSDDTD